MAEGDVVITQKPKAPPEPPEKPSADTGIELPVEQGVDFSPPPEPEQRQLESPAQETQVAAAPPPEDSPIIPWDAIRVHLDSMANQPLQQPPMQIQPQQLTPQLPRVDLSKLAEKPEEAIQEYGQQLREQVTREVTAMVRAEQTQRDRTAVINRVTSNFEHGKNNFETRVMADPAWNDPKFKREITSMINTAMDVVLRRNGDPQASEAFRNPDFFDGLIAVAKQKAGYRGQARSFQPQGARVLGAKQGLASSPSRTPIEPERSTYLQQWGVSQEEFEENERLGSKGW